MKSTSYILMLFIIGIFVIGGCRSNPVLNIDNAAIAVNQKYSVKDVKKAILRAGGSLGWQMNEKVPGHIVGKLVLRSHVAVVDIMYDKTKYSIKYKDSTNLNYDGTNIHSNYNGWVQRLNQNIQVQLSNM